jgi:hypothetical protein
VNGTRSRRRWRRRAIWIHRRRCGMRRRARRWWTRTTSTRLLNHRPRINVDRQRSFDDRSLSELSLSGAGGRGSWGGGGTMMESYESACTPPAAGCGRCAARRRRPRGSRSNPTRWSVRPGTRSAARSCRSAANRSAPSPPWTTPRGRCSTTTRYVRSARQRRVVVGLAQS